MKKMWKKILGVCFMTAAVTNVTGCVISQQECEKQICTMLEEKYGEEFAVSEYLGLERMENKYGAVCYSQKYQDILFEAEAACDGTYISDEYIASRVCRKIENQMTDNLKGLPGYIQIKVQSVSKTVDSSDSDMTVETFASIKEGNRFAVYLHYCPIDNNVRAVYRSLKNAFQGLECLNGNIQFYIVDEETLKSVQRYLEEHAKLDYGHDGIVENAERITIPFENGIIQMTEEEFVKNAGERV